MLVAIDDLQWLDPPSADALAFAARRLDGARVRFLLARRPRRVGALERALGRGALARIDVGPLDLDATRGLLAGRLGVSVSRPLLRRVADTTLGNPLFALELGRTLALGGPPALGAELIVPEAVEDVLGTRVAALPDEQRRILLAASLSGDIKVGELIAAAGAERVEAAIDAGLLRVDGEHVRASHPLLAAAARQRSGASERRALHQALAGAVADPELRAQHLALATRRPDAALAETVAAAAAAAAARGARQEAVLLAEHALRLTPDGDAERPERLLALAGYLEHAGELQRVTDLLTPELDALPAGPLRARAWIALSEGGDARTLEDIERHLDAALAEAGDDAVVRAFVLARRAAHMAGFAVADLGAAETMAREALALAAGGEHERLALDALAWVLALQGRPIDELCARFRAVSDAASFLAESPERTAEQRLVWRGELASAAPALTTSLTRADEQGEPVSYALQRLHLCELHLRTGDWDAAAALLAEWAESAEAELLVQPMYQRCRALLAAGQGRPAEAEAWAARAIAAAAGGRRRLGPARGAARARLGAAARARARRGGRRPPRRVGALRGARDRRAGRLPGRAGPGRGAGGAGRARRGARRDRAARAAGRGSGPPVGAGERAPRRGHGRARRRGGRGRRARGGRGRAARPRPAAPTTRARCSRSAAPCAGGAPGAPRARRWSGRRRRSTRSAATAGRSRPAPSWSGSPPAARGPRASSPRPRSRSAGWRPRAARTRRSPRRSS